MLNILESLINAINTLFFTGVVQILSRERSVVSYMGHKNSASSGLCESVGVINTFVFTKQHPHM